MSRGFRKKERPAEITIEIRVAKKQKRTIFVSQAEAKSAPEMSWNKRAGRAALNTNLFIPFTKESLNKPAFLKKQPKSKVKKIGIVAFKQKIRFSMIIFPSKK